eukprot:gene21503-24390_t
MTFPAGSVYVGEFAESRMHGKGVFTTNVGAVYEGNMADGRFHGEGKITTPDGATTEGTFVQGLLQGNGVHRSLIGYSYVGRRAGEDAASSAEEDRLQWQDLQGGTESSLDIIDTSPLAQETQEQVAAMFEQARAARELTSKRCN